MFMALIVGVFFSSAGFVCRAYSHGLVLSPAFGSFVLLFISLLHVVRFRLGFCPVSFGGRFLAQEISIFRIRSCNTLCLSATDWFRVYLGAFKSHRRYVSSYGTVCASVMPEYEG